MRRFHSTTVLTFFVILLCSTYWLFHAVTPSPTSVLFSKTSVERPDQDKAAFKETHPKLTQQNVANLDPEIQDEGLAVPDSKQEEMSRSYESWQRTSATHDVMTPSPKPDLADPLDSPLLPQGYSAAFPRHVWQTSSTAGKEKYAEKMKTWQKVSGFKHHWMSDADADTFVHEVFSTKKPSLVAFWDDLSATISPSQTLATTGITNASSDSSEIVVDSTASSSIVLRADLLRYMLMSVRGGIYGDIDTSVEVHPDRWIPIDLGSQVINAIIGIEYDDTTKAMFVRPISFCQWTLMSKPGHPIFARAIDRVVSNLEFLARHQRVSSLSQLKVEKLDVLEATGPGMISDVVLEVIRDQLPGENITWSTFHGLKEAKLFGDVLVLPINGFAGAQKHSHAGDPEYGPMFVRHHFGRSWYRPASPKAATIQ